MRSLLVALGALSLGACATSTATTSDVSAPPEDLAGLGDLGASDLAASTTDLAPSSPDLVVARDLLPPVPRLVDLTPQTLTIAVGKAFPLTAVFDAKYFGSAPVVLMLSSSDPSVVTVPASATLTFNNLSVPFNAAAVKVGTAQVSATHDGVTETSDVTVIPAVKSLSPAPLRVQLGQTGALTVTLTDPAQAGGHDVLLASADPSIVTVPAMVHVNAGATTATFAVTTIKWGGPVAITATLAGSTTAASVTSLTPVTRLAISEVLYNSLGTMGDVGYEWVELWNGGGTDVDLSGYYLATTSSSMSATYFGMTLQLSGTLKAGECKVVGGPLADPAINALATGFMFAPAVQFNPSLPNGTATTAVGVGLFQGTSPGLQMPVSITSGSFVDALIYGTMARGIADESGGTTRLDVGYVPFPKQTLERTGPGAWRIQQVPSGGSCDWLHL